MASFCLRLIEFRTMHISEGSTRKYRQNFHWIAPICLCAVIDCPIIQNTQLVESNIHYRVNLGTTCDLKVTGSTCDLLAEVRLLRLTLFIIHLAVALCFGPPFLLKPIYIVGSPLVMY